MATPSGTITIQDINTELCRSPTASLNLNDSDVRHLAGKPAGAISMDDLRNKVFITASLQGGTYGDVGNRTPGAEASLSYSLTGGAEFVGGVNSGTLLNRSWITKAVCGGATSYQAKAENLGGPAAIGTYDTWIEINEATWTFTRYFDFFVNNPETAAFIVQIRKKSNFDVIASGIVQLTVGF